MAIENEIDSWHSSPDVTDDDEIIIVDRPEGVRRIKRVKFSTLRSSIAATQTGAFFVSDYGAVADGITDDTAAINAAITAANAAGGGTVFLTPGTYGITLALAGAALCESGFGRT